MIGSWPYCQFGLSCRLLLFSNIVYLDFGTYFIVSLLFDYFLFDFVFIEESVYLKFGVLSF